MNMRRIIFVGGIILGLIFPISAQAAANLTVTPVTWNIIGLDSNSPASGPCRFPVGARVCNTGTSASGNVTADLVWDDGQGVFVGDVNADPYINLRAGSLSSVSLGTIAVGSCSDAYFEAEVNRVPAAYDQIRRYHITATDSIVAGTSPQPRELYVEHLISQNRNSISDVKLNGVSVPSGGSMTLMVGNTYTIELVGGTATQGYNQFEAFINFPNTIFQILSVSTIYSADNSPYVPNPSDKLYADACLWESDPNSPNYRSCVGGDYKAGGSNVVTTYTVKVISGGGTSQTLNSLLYDFSGSSFHYNGDYTTGTRIVNVIGPSSVTISKTFTPKAIAPDGTSAMTFRLANPTTETFTGVNFTDTLLGGLKVAATPGVTYGGCGTGVFSPALVADATSLSFSGGTLAPNSVCTINVNVTAPAGTYPNTTGHLFINTSVDTGNTGNDTLTASSAPGCTPGQQLATWTFEPAAGTGVPPLYTTKAANVSTATASYTAGGTGGAQNINTVQGSPAVYSWEGSGFQKNVEYTSTTAPYFDLAIDTSKYANVSISLRSYATANWGNDNILRVWSISDGGTSFVSTTPATGTLTKTTWSGDQTFAAATTGSSTTIFRINADGANPSGASMMLDNIVVTGCSIPTPPPTITKSFLSDPIIKGATTTLRFTINNTAAGNQALTGIAFTDVLPAGLSIIDSSSAQCGGTLTTTAAPRTIALTGGSLAAGGSCTINVTVTGASEGQYDNVSGYISSTQSGTSTNYATDSLSVIAPPTIAKSFSQTSILVNGSSTLTFSITNPNQLTALSGITFTDNLPAGVTATNGTTNSLCGSGSLVISGGNLFTFTGGSINANSSCSFSVPVTGTTVGTKNNTTSAVTSTEGGNGNAASATLVVSNPQPLLSLNKEISTDNTNWFKYVGVPLPPPRNVYYRFTVSNDGEMTLNTVNVTDPNVSMVGCTPALPSALVIGASASCVVGPVSITSVPAPNPFVNTATATTTTYLPPTPITSSAKYGTRSLSIAKSVTESYFSAAGDVLHYSYVVTNTGGYPLAGPVTVADDKSTDEACPAASTVGDGDDYLDPGESITCAATYTVSNGDVTAKFVTNTASATVDGVTSPTDSKTVYLVPDLTVTKGNNVAGTVELGNTFDWTLTVGNTGGSASFANGQALLTDELPTSGASYSMGTVSKAGGTTGTIDCTITSNTLTCTASGDVAIPSSGSFSVPVTVTPTGIGSLVNPRSGRTCAADPAGVVPESNEGNNNCSDTVTVTAAAPSANLSITKTDGVGSVSAGGTTTYTITVTNNGPSSVTGAFLTDAAATGLSKTAVTCSGTPGKCVSAPSIAQLEGGSYALPALAKDETYQITVTATVTATSGSVSNTATVAAPVGTTDPDGTNNSATDTDTINPSADLSITKTDGVTTYTPGGTTTYTIVVSNGGPSDVTGAAFTDNKPSQVTSWTWSCVADAGASCTAGPSTSSANYTDSVSIPSGKKVTYTVVATLGSSASGDLVNTASIAAPGGATDPTPGNNSATDTDTINPVADLAIEKKADKMAPAAGDTVVFTLTVTNHGPSDATGVEVLDHLPSGVTHQSNTSGGAYNPVTGIWQIGNLASSASASITITVTVNQAGRVVNIATITGSDVPDPDLSNNSSGLILNLGGQADLGIGKEVDKTNPAVNDTAVFTLTVTNSGPDSVTGVVVSDVLPAGLTYQSDTSGGAYNSGTGVWTVGNLNVGGSATIQITARVNAAGEKVNTARITGSSLPDPDKTNNEASVVVNPTHAQIADLAVQKTVNQAVVSFGGNAVFTIVVRNNGPDDATGVNVEDVLPSGVGYVSSLSTQGTYTSGTGIWDVGSLLAGAYAVLDITIQANDVTPQTNTASIDSLDQFDPNSSNDSSSAVVSTTATADLRITKDDGVTSVSAGGSTTYTITVTNNGPSSVTGAVLTDGAAAGLSKTGVACSGTPGKCVSAPSIAQLEAGFALPALAKDETYQITVTATVTEASGSASNTATVTAPSGVPDPDTGNNTATDTDTVNPVADLSITKTDSPDPVIAGQQLTYTVTVSNAGPSNAQNVKVTDTLPGGVTLVSTSGCTEDPSGVPTCSLGTIDALGSKQYTITVTVSTGTAGTLTNQVSVNSDTSDSNTSNNTTSQQTTVSGSADLSITKTDGQATAVPDQTVTYTIEASNAGPSNVTGATVTDTMPASLSGVTWTCSGSGGATCTANGSGNISDTVNIPVNGKVTYMVTGTVSASATGNLVNTATVSAPAGVTDPASGNNSATDTDTLTPQADLSITKTENPDPVVAGQNVTYTVTVTNNGPSSASNVTVTDTLPGGVTFVSASGMGWNCSESGGTVTCTRATLALGAAPGISIVVTAPSSSGTITNNVAVSSDTTDPNSGNNSASAQTTVNVQAVPDLTITKTHTGSFTQGQAGAQYTITMTNLGPGVTSGTVTVVDTLPTGLTATGMSGTGWSCTLGTLTCTRSDVLAASASYPVITLTVNVASNAASSLTNIVTVSGGGESNTANNTATDPTTINPSGPNLYDPPNVTKTVDGRGLPILRYMAVLINSGNGPALGVVFTDSIPQNTIYVVNSITLNGAPVSDTYGDADGGFDQINNRIVVNIGTINPGSQAVISFSVSVNSGFSGTISNQGRVSGSNVADRLTDDPRTSPTNDPTLFYVKSAVPVPTLNEWGFLILLTLSGLVAVHHLRRRRGMG